MNHRIISLSIVTCLAAAAQPAMAGPPVINEFVANHVGTDTHEFVEVYGDPATDYSTLTILEIEGDGSGAGVIDGAYAVGVTDAAGFWMTGFMNNMIENGTMTLLLVENFTGLAGDDLDTDNDGTLDSTPFAAILDQVSVTDGGVLDHAYGAVVLSPGYDGVLFTPGGASRIPNGTDSDAVADWVRNDFDGAGLPGFTGTPVTGEALNTPGAANQLFIPPPDPVINEFLFNHVGIDTYEYVELFGEPNTNYSHLAVVAIDGDGTQAGRIDAIFTAGTTDTAGFWTTPFQSNVLENGTNTLLLVDGFFGYDGQDLDTDDDGVLDITPYARLVDDVAVRNGNPGDQTYASVVLLENYDGDPATVGGASRIPNGTDTDAVTDWVRNDYDGEGLPGFTGSPNAGEALNTPGTTNLTAVDTTPPVVTVSVTPSVLWPPNHKLVDVCATVTVTDDREPAPTYVLTSITSNEPDNGIGDGNTVHDIRDAFLGTGDLCFTLRAERAGSGNGREYTVVYTATDGAGNEGTGMAVVLVPHDQSGAALASAGFSGDGTAIDTAEPRFALVIPSSPGLFSMDDGVILTIEGLDASRIDPWLAYVGNNRGVLRPVESLVMDVNGDQLDDLVLYYSTSEALQLLTNRTLAGPPQPDAVSIDATSSFGLHFEGPDGTQYLATNIFALGEPVAIPGGAKNGATGEERLDVGATPASSVSIQPNPFNPSTIISFDVTAAAPVVLRVFDVRGAVVRTLKNETLAAGTYRVPWNGRDDHGRVVSSGVYFIRFESGSTRSTHRAVLLK